MDARSGEVSGGIYSSFRSNGAPTYYGSIDTAWHADILQAGIYFAAATLLASFILIVPGYTGKSVSFTFGYFIECFL
ncbi:hypothetical protein DPMN_010204 [Dreissena polymorpha]|uniref:Uncharacterized protein n=1 Tax=Dreissena polymorpha TaxID=45954 RepID=A0A9D4MYE5_DREPO|nr:hypothetical protein DPMN_010204 [Dreissena polymorpha]